ncbi:FolC bifunctional protein [Dentipellis sp. KUC8613]|nr:FolC bifunctional protein [Dentipellis sp. KUC8613]
MSTRTYKDAVDRLNSLQSNAATLEAVRALGGRASTFAIPEMVEYLERIGYTQEDLNALNVIHITGTKGKGSTCAFLDSVLRHTKPNWKIGLYTSPHLIAVRERIRVNGQPLSEEDFAKYFFEVWDRLEKNEQRKFPETAAKPAYFRYMTLVAFHAFLSMKVDATILEVGVGGTYDSTNIVPHPVVTGISALGIDHTAVLGKTLEEIAWQKGGIYKAGVPALTVDQPEQGLAVLKQRSVELKASEFQVVPLTPQLADIRLGLPGQHQVQNANLAIHLASKFLQIKDGYKPHESLSETFVEGLESAKWPGRCQAVADPQYPSTTWFLDGAHTVESLECCMQWFVSPDVALRDVPGGRPRRILIFNCTSGRSGSSFLGTMLSRAAVQLKLFGANEEAGQLLDHVIFCTNITYADGGFKGDLTTLAIPEDDLTHLKTQQDLASAWSSLVPTFPKANIHVLPSIEHAIGTVRSLSTEKGREHTDVLVAGSLHLVGGVIEIAGLADVAL